MKTVLTHFYNEEYLLPWWLAHHKQYFDHGILVDQNSTDASVEICKTICPDWEVVKSRNVNFDCCGTDAEMEELESALTGWRTTLCTTEFLVGDYTFLDTTDKDRHEIISYIIADPVHEKDNKPDHDLPLIKQKYYGYHAGRPSRSIHKKSIPYRFGRHFVNVTTDRLAIFWYGWSPWTQEFIDRKLQIKHKIPEIDISRGFGTHHLQDAEALHNSYTEINKVYVFFDMREEFPLAYKN